MAGVAAGLDGRITAGAGRGGRFVWQLFDAGDRAGAVARTTGDRFRLVRARAAAALAPWPAARWTPRTASGSPRRPANTCSRSTTGLTTGRRTTTAGTTIESCGELAQALNDYATASKLRPDVVPPLVNASVLHARLGETVQAEQVLKQALAAEPINAEANFNYGLLLAEKGDLPGAERRLRPHSRPHPTWPRPPTTCPSSCARPSGRSNPVLPASRCSGTI